MAYTLNEYYQYCITTDTRIELYSDNDTAANLLAFHKDSGAKMVCISDHIPADTEVLPMPDSLLSELDKSVIAAGKRAVVVGIDSYLALLDENNISAFFVALHGRIEEQKLNTVFLLGNSYSIDKHFSNPKYENSLQIVRINSNIQRLTPPNITVVPEKWLNVDHTKHTNYKSLLKSLGNFMPVTGEYVLVLKDLIIMQAGLSNNVRFLFDIKAIAERFYNIDSDMLDNTLEMLISKCKEKSAMPNTLLSEKFGSNNINPRLALKRLLELLNDALWPAYIWWLRNIIVNNSYLAKTLSTTVLQGNLLYNYVVGTAVDVLNDNNAAIYATERAEAIKEIGDGAESVIIEFVEKINSQSSDVVARFLNCGTEMELREIVRRVSRSDLVTGVPELFKSLYPALTDYLSSVYDYGNNEINLYFEEYRKLKIKNSITTDFVKRAFDITIPDSFRPRDSVLAELSSDNDTALLIVDGMGAEFYPLLLSMAKRYSRNIDSCSIVYANLPTTTDYNPIMWDIDRILDQVKEVDNIVHNGAVKHENCPFERNIVASLMKFETEIFNCIATGLTEYSRVVVTADHGSSRLAVLAHNKRLVTTLPWNGEPLDWRYSVAPKNTQRPPEFESKYNAKDNKTYWVVRGYNRLPKKGPKFNELHGGATLEERLVPIIVFSRTKSDFEPKQLVKETIQQIVEKKDFDVF